MSVLRRSLDSFLVKKSLEGQLFILRCITCLLGFDVIFLVWMGRCEGQAGCVCACACVVFECYFVHAPCVCV